MAKGERKEKGEDSICIYDRHRKEKIQHSLYSKSPVILLNVTWEVWAGHLTSISLDTVLIF